VWIHLDAGTTQNMEGPSHLQCAKRTRVRGKVELTLPIDRHRADPLRRLFLNSAATVAAFCVRKERVRIYVYLYVFGVFADLARHFSGL